MYKEKSDTKLYAFLLFLIWPACAYILLPQDWMGEYRFATPFIVSFYTYLVIVINNFVKSLNLKRSFSISLLIFCVLIGLNVFVFSRKGGSGPFSEKRR